MFINIAALPVGKGGPGNEPFRAGGEKSLRLDFHVHTYYSPDSLLTPQRLLTRCRQIGLSGIAITDHNTIRGALEAQALAEELLVIVGEEVKTTEGEVTGLFLTQEIPPGLSPEETVARIKAQGGLAGVSHPFDRLRRSALSPMALRRLAYQLDFLEVFNSRTTLLRHNATARAFAQEHGLLMVAGSDAHLASEVGGAYVEMEPFDGVAGFKEVLQRGKITGKRASFLVHLASTLAKLRKRRRLKPG